MPGQFGLCLALLALAGAGASNETALWVLEPNGNVSAAAGSHVDILVATTLGAGTQVALYLLDNGELWNEDESSAEIELDVRVDSDMPFDWRIPSYIPAGTRYAVQALVEPDLTVEATGPLFEITEPGETLLWLVGIGVSIAGSVASNLGVNMQKYSLMQESRTRAKAAMRSYVKQPLWAIGLLLVIVGSLGDFAALAFAPQSLVAPVGGFTMAVNLGFANKFLGEPVRRRDLVATASLVAGIVVIALYAEKTSRSYTLSQLLELYVRPAMLGYYVGVGGTCVALFSFARHIEKVERESGIGSPQYRPLRPYHPFTYASLSGVLGAQSVLLAKSTAELLKSTLEGENQFTKIPTYLIVLGMFFFIFSQIHWLTTGLSRFDAVYCVPVFQCFFIVTSVIGGGIYFSELDGLSHLQVVMFSFGVALTLLGVYMLSQREMRKLAPLQRFRAAVYSVIFVGAVSKAARGARWEYALDSPHHPAAAGASSSVPQSPAGSSLRLDPITAEDLATGAVGYAAIPNALMEIAGVLRSNAVAACIAGGGHTYAMEDSPRSAYELQPVALNFTGSPPPPAHESAADRLRRESIEAADVNVEADVAVVMVSRSSSSSPTTP